MKPQPNVSPQQQAQYDSVMLAARGIIYGDPKQPDNIIGFQTVLKKLAQGKSEIGTTIGHTAAMIMKAVQGGIEAKGKQVPGDVLFHAGQEVVADLIQIAEDANIMSKSKEEAVRKQALFEGMRAFNQAKQAPQPQAQGAAQPQAAPAAQPAPDAAPQPQPTQTGVIGAAMQGA